YGTLLALRARLEMAEGQYDRAVSTLQTGFHLARHVAEVPTTTTALIGLAIAELMLRQVEDLVQAPGARNLYWALADLPRPFISLRRPLQGEMMMASASLSRIVPLRDLE